MTPATPSRKKSLAPKPGKAAAGTIRVAKVIVPVVPLRPAVRAASDPEEDLAPGLPCEGRCGHCHHHPCRLHGGV